ncbi:MAG: hypothetical protein Unbinned3329contig1000_6 [Prokaryotic dsDNA virus sp.]|jgi:hypothetical protein|nr:MAG: hypothetical protein Unbinned3329contig1000_6 [Prokaryotic dsDNA virus sp.]|tara:strand:+ start:424 stop:864 length:441 start_codon:yes stop_codon:yes gene_type:complete
MKIFFNSKLISLKFGDRVSWLELFNSRICYYKTGRDWSLHFKFNKKYKFIRNSDLDVKRIQFREWWQDTKLKLYPFSVYYEFHSMDCDNCESWRAYKFKNGRKALKYMQDSFEWAEGFTYWNRLTKKEYEEYKSYTRDHRAEYYNY